LAERNQSWVVERGETGSESGTYVLENQLSEATDWLESSAAP